MINNTFTFEEISKLFILMEKINEFFHRRRSIEEELNKFTTIIII